MEIMYSGHLLASIHKVLLNYYFLVLLKYVIILPWRAGSGELVNQSKFISINLLVGYGRSRHSSLDWLIGVDLIKEKTTKLFNSIQHGSLVFSLIH